MSQPCAKRTKCWRRQDRTSLPTGTLAPRVSHRAPCSLLGLVLAIIFAAGSAASGQEFDFPSSPFADAPLLVANSDAPSVLSRPIGVDAPEPATPAADPSQDIAPFMVDFGFRPISSLTTDIAPRSPIKPADVAPTKLAEIGDLSVDTVLERRWMGLRYCWDAPALSHRPLYFEEVNLERYGYGPRYLRAAQPVVSGAHFFATIPALPYCMAVDPPWKRVSPLGHYRPGSPAPYRIHHPPFSVRGSVSEVLTLAGLIILIP